MTKPRRNPPAWESVEIGHNGGPPLGSGARRRGRPTIATPELQDRIFELLLDGVPLAVICRAEGMPGRQTVYDWRRADPAIDNQIRFAQQEGYIHLCEVVVDEVDRMITTRGVKLARWWFNRRRQQLSSQNPRFFGAM
jgi:hypothetical protein